MPGGPVAERVDRFDRRIEPVEQRAQLAQHALARFGKGDAAGRAVEQADPEPLLERPHGLAQGRGRKPQPLGRLGEARLLGDGHEGAQFSKLRSPHGLGSMGNGRLSERAPA
jgi:hypothetical protein